MRILRASIVALFLGGTSLAAFSLPSQAQISISVHIAPPILPVYVQPPIPAPGYLWAPGYWAWGGADYYWVPGTWVQAPRPGLLWTPSYWGWSEGNYLFHAGYWGPHVGFYGGVAYGFGYTGFGFAGGYWNGGQFFYNHSVNNFGNTNITNVYSKTVINNTTINKVSYNGGPGGVTSKPTAEQLAADKEDHVQATEAQQKHVEAASKNKDLQASNNHGKPSIAATSHAGEFKGAGVVGAHGHETKGDKVDHKGSDATNDAESKKSDTKADKPPKTDSGDTKVEKKHHASDDAAKHNDKHGGKPGDDVKQGDTRKGDDAKRADTRKGDDFKRGGSQRGDDVRRGGPQRGEDGRRGGPDRQAFRPGPHPQREFRREGGGCRNPRQCH